MRETDRLVSSTPSELGLGAVDLKFLSVRCISER